MYLSYVLQVAAVQQLPHSDFLNIKNASDALRGRMHPLGELPAPNSTAPNTALRSTTATVPVVERVMPYAAAAATQRPAPSVNTALDAEADVSTPIALATADVSRSHSRSSHVSWGGVG
jgi:hypothetical protein